MLALLIVLGLICHNGNVNNWSAAAMLQKELQISVNDNYTVILAM